MLLCLTKGGVNIGTQKFNKSAYDQRLIRFPKGTIDCFNRLFKNDVSFNGWVVNLVVSRLIALDKQFSHSVNFKSTKPPKM